ncbi:MAG TPA: VIT family protein [Candidatus Polarisedimenticolia bacterium]|nr:VIT family protein [Candidatus Polarisedimenticolia bacterium]
MRPRHKERHKTGRVGWLRAAVLGANDGIVSTTSLVVGVAASGASQQAVLVAGAAGLVAGAMSMAAGEYVSVSSQADTERAELDREAEELRSSPEAEETELAGIYAERGLPPDLSRQVAQGLMTHDALAAHARDELGITETLTARPLQAAVASAASFAVGAALPLIAAGLAHENHLGLVTSGSSLACLGLLGALAARAGGAPLLAGAGRVLLWGVLAMAATAAVGSLFHTAP